MNSPAGITAVTDRDIYLTFLKIFSRIFIILIFLHFYECMFLTIPFENLLKVKSKLTTKYFLEKKNYQNLAFLRLFFSKAKAEECD